MPVATHKGVGALAPAPDPHAEVCVLDWGLRREAATQPPAGPRRARSESLGRRRFGDIRGILMDQPLVQACVETQDAHHVPLQEQLHSPTQSRELHQEHKPDGIYDLDEAYARIGLLDGQQATPLYHGSRERGNASTQSADAHPEPASAVKEEAH